MYVVLEGLTVNCNIFICLLCCKDNFGPTYTYTNCVEGKNWILHIFMYNVTSDFSGARRASERRVKKLDNIFYHALIVTKQTYLFTFTPIQGYSLDFRHFF